MCGGVGEGVTTGTLNRASEMVGESLAANTAKKREKMKEKS